MVETNSRDTLNFDVTDSTVSVYGATVRLGNDIREFRGGQIQLSDMTNPFGVGYQYSVLCLTAFNGTADFTSVYSDVTSSVRALNFPTLPIDGTDYSSLKPLGLFTLYTDSSGVELVSYSKVL